MPTVNKVTLKRNPYASLSLKKENHTIVTQPVQRVSPTLSANLVDIPTSPYDPNDRQRRQQASATILTDFKEMSEHLEETMSDLFEDGPFLKKMRFFLQTFNATYILLEQYDQIFATNFSDFVQIKLRESEGNLSSFGISLTSMNSLSINVRLFESNEPKIILDAFFVEKKVFALLIAYFNDIVSGNTHTKVPTLTKLHGLIIDKLG